MFPKKKWFFERHACIIEKERLCGGRYFIADITAGFPFAKGGVHLSPGKRFIFPGNGETEKSTGRGGFHMRLEGKNVVITGASSGMGKAIAALFVQEGANVVITARRKERLDSLAEELKEAPGKIIAVAGDVSKQEDIEGAIDTAVREFGKLDILINNAGIMDDMSPIGEATNEKLDAVFSINVFGPFYGMRKAVQVFQEQGGGNIINIASLGGMRSCAGAIYCASKAAVISLTKNTSFMYQEEGIRVNAIAPGGINTEIATSMGMPNMAGYGRVQKVLAAAPAPGEAEDIANAALFLASEESKYINGDVLIVDGGWNAG